MKEIYSEIFFANKQTKTRTYLRIIIRESEFLVRLHSDMFKSEREVTVIDP